MAALTNLCQIGPVSEAWVADGFCVGEIPVSFNRVRAIEAVPNSNNFFTLERSTESLVLVEDLNFDGIPESNRSIVTFDGLNHGFVFSSKYLYASTSNDVYRWEYNFTTNAIIGSNAVDAAELVITNINDDGNGGLEEGNHFTRTLLWKQATNTLYVQVGSYGNIDENPYRSKIRTFVLDESGNSTAGSTPSIPIQFKDGAVFIDGIRNVVALEFSPKDGTLWGAGNAGDLLFRTDLGGPIYQDNPGDELHQFVEIGENYGYPYCWREFRLPGLTGRGRGTAWSYSGGRTDDRSCRQDYTEPKMVLQAHSAPLGLTFYSYNNNPPVECNGVIPFPEEMDGYMFIAYHGSWNRLVPTGYKIVYIPMTADGNIDYDSTIGSTSPLYDGNFNPIDLLRHEGAAAQWSDGFRPVDVSFDVCGRLLVSSDGTRGRGSKVVRIESTSTSYIPPPEASRRPIRRFFTTLFAIFVRFASILRSFF